MYGGKSSNHTYPRRNTNNELKRERCSKINMEMEAKKSILCMATNSNMNEVKHTAKVKWGQIRAVII